MKIFVLPESKQDLDEKFVNESEPRLVSELLPPTSKAAGETAWATEKDELEEILK